MDDKKYIVICLCFIYTIIILALYQFRIKESFMNLETLNLEIENLEQIRIIREKNYNEMSENTKKYNELTQKDNNKLLISKNETTDAILYLRKLMETYNIEEKEFSIQSRKSNDNYVDIPIFISGASKKDNIINFLHQIENGQYFYKINSLSIVSNENNDTLSIKLKLSIYAQNS